jgi:hypothetical protein
MATFACDHHIVAFIALFLEFGVVGAWWCGHWRMFFFADKSLMLSWKGETDEARFVVILGTGWGGGCLVSIADW